MAAACCIAFGDCSFPDKHAKVCLYPKCKLQTLICSKVAKLPLGLEAPVMTPNGVIFLFFSFLSLL